MALKGIYLFRVKEVEKNRIAYSIIKASNLKEAIKTIEYDYPKPRYTYEYDPRFENAAS